MRLLGWLLRRVVREHTDYAKGVVAEDNVSWQAAMILNYAKDETDWRRQMALADLALAMIEQEEVINPPDVPPEVMEARKQLTGALLGMREVVEVAHRKVYDA